MLERQLNLLLRLEVNSGRRDCVLPLDDAVVVQFSFRCQHDGILLPGDLEQSRLGKPFGDMTDYPR